MQVSPVYVFLSVLGLLIRNSECYESLTSQGNNDSSTSYHIEALIVSEYSMQEYHKENVTSYLATLIQLVNEVFSSETLNVNLTVSITKMILMDALESSNVIIENNKMRSLQRSCFWVTGQTNEDEHDLVLFLTRRNFGTDGYSPEGAMCSGRRSCSLIQDVGYRSAFIIAHEICHLFGLQHDDHCFNGASDLSIMATKIQVSFSNYQWTNCSQTILRDSIGEFSCLSHQHSDISEPCAYVSGRNTTACPWYTYIDETCEYGVCVLKDYKTVTKTPSSEARDTTPTGPVTVPPKSQPGYQWVRINEWTKCSSPCGGGATYPKYECQRSSDKSQVSNSFCNREDFRPRGKECNTNPCGSIQNKRTFMWKTSRWSECRAKKCGLKGKQTRKVNCIRSVNGVKKSVNKSKCKQNGEMPTTKKSCRRTCL